MNGNSPGVLSSGDLAVAERSEGERSEPRSIWRVSSAARLGAHTSVELIAVGYFPNAVERCEFATSDCAYHSAPEGSMV